MSLPNIRLVTAPSGEPVSLAEAQAWIRKDVDGADIEDDLLLSLITAARESAEEYIEWLLTDAEYEFRVDGFCDAVKLPYAQVSAVTEVSYVDSDGNPQVLATSIYVFDDNPRWPALRLAYGQSWPSTRDQANAVTITFNGYFTEATSPPVRPPETIRLAMRLSIGDWYRHRGDTIIGKSAQPLPMGAKYLLDKYRVGMGV